MIEMRLFVITHIIFGLPFVGAAQENPPKEQYELAYMQVCLELADEMHRRQIAEDNETRRTALFAVQSNFEMGCLGAPGDFCLRRQEDAAGCFRNLNIWMVNEADRLLAHFPDQISAASVRAERYQRDLAKARTGVVEDPGCVDEENASGEYCDYLDRTYHLWNVRYLARRAVEYGRQAEKTE